MDAAELAFAGPLRQAELIRDGEISPRELVQVYLDRIERIDPQLNAFRIVLAERALTEAKQAGRRKTTQERPLLGVPFAIKDNHDLTGEVTTHGTGAYDRTPAREDAEIVRRLRAAGDSEPTLDEILPGPIAHDPVNQVISSEELHSLVACLSSVLSELESSVLSLYLDGHSYEAIAERLACDTKTVDNALQRVKRKVGTHLDSRAVPDSET